MKLKISKELKETVIGGAIAGAVVGVESGLSWFVAGYPQILKDKLNANLPRNGALVADAALIGSGYMLKKKRTSARTQNMANGFLFYDIPKLIDQFGYNIGYTAGGGGLSLGAPLRLNNMVGNSMRLQIRPYNNNNSAGVPTIGRYALKTAPSRRTAMVGGLGKYR